MVLVNNAKLKFILFYFITSRIRLPYILKLTMFVTQAHGIFIFKHGMDKYCLLV